MIKKVRGGWEVSYFDCKDVVFVSYMVLMPYLKQLKKKGFKHPREILETDLNYIVAFNNKYGCEGVSDIIYRYARMAPTPYKLSYWRKK